MQGDLGAHGRRLLGSRLVFLLILKGFRGRHLDVFANFETRIVFFGMRVCRSRFLKILGSESGSLGLQNQAFGQKTAFHIRWDYVDFGVIFTWFSMALGPILVTFGGLGAGLKHHDFRWFSGGSPS